MLVRYARHHDRGARRAIGVAVAFAAVMAAAACGDSSLTAANGGALNGSYALDSVGSKRPPVFLGSSGGESLYLLSLTISFDGSSSYLGNEVDSTVGSFPVDEVNASSLTGGYRVVGDSVALSGIGTGHLTSNGFKLEGTQIGTFYFSKR